MSEQDNLELKKKAKKYIKEKRWDYLLINAYLEIKHFQSWSKNNDFEKNWNIGLSNISSKKRKLEFGYTNDDIELINANFKNIDFAIGINKENKFSHPIISLFIEEKVVLTIHYFINVSNPNHAFHFSMDSVEELHTNPKISELLEGIEKAIDEKDESDKLKRKQEDNKSYEGKFTFDLDENELQETIKEKLESEKIILINSIDKKNQDNPYKKFLRNNFIIIFVGLFLIFVAIVS